MTSQTDTTDSEEPRARPCDGTPIAKPGRPLVYPELGDAEWLRARYVDDGLSADKIAELVDFDCHRQSVWNALCRHGIPRRKGGAR